MQDAERTAETNIRANVQRLERQLGGEPHQAAAGEHSEQQDTRCYGADPDKVAARLQNPVHQSVQNAQGNAVHIRHNAQNTKQAAASGVKAVYRGVKRDEAF